MRVNDFRPFINLLVLLTALVFMFPNDSNAYLDMQSGSYMLQILLAAVFTWLFVAKRLWSRITSFLGAIFFEQPEHKG